MSKAKLLGFSWMAVTRMVYAGMATIGLAQMESWSASELASIALPILPFLLHLALVFPKRHPVTSRYPYIFRWIYGLPLLAVSASWLGWTQKPNLDVKSRIPGRDWVVRFRTNPDGITPAEARHRRQPRTRRVMIFGDSTVLGRSVPRDRTVTQQLERLLSRGGVKTEVINAGVQGYSTDQVLLHIRRLAPLYRPDVVIYGFCLNDLGGIGLRRAYGLPKPMFVPNARDQLELLPPELDRSAIPSFGQGPRKWLQDSALYRLLQPQILLLRSHLMSWEERNLLGLPDEIYYRGLVRRHVNGELLAVLLSEMNKVCLENGVRFLFYSHPSIQEVWDAYIRRVQTKLRLAPGQYDRYALEEFLAGTAKEVSVAFCPLVDYFVSQQNRGPFHLLPRDPHCNPVGYRLQAEALARFLSQSGMLADIRPIAGAHSQVTLSVGLRVDAPGSPLR